MWRKQHTNCGVTAKLRAKLSDETTKALDAVQIGGSLPGGSTTPRATTEALRTFRTPCVQTLFHTYRSMADVTAKATVGLLIFLVSNYAVEQSVHVNA